MVSAGVDAGMRHLVGRIGRVRRCAWWAGRLMGELVLPTLTALPLVRHNGANELAACACS